MLGFSFTLDEQSWKLSFDTKIVSDQCGFKLGHLIFNRAGHVQKVQTVASVNFQNLFVCLRNIGQP